MSLFGKITLLFLLVPFSVQAESHLMTNVNPQHIECKYKDHSIGYEEGGMIADLVIIEVDKGVLSWSEEVFKGRGRLVRLLGPYDRRELADPKKAFYQLTDHVAYDLKMAKRIHGAQSEQAQKLQEEYDIMSREFVLAKNKWKQCLEVRDAAIESGNTVMINKKTGDIIIEQEEMASADLATE